MDGGDDRGVDALKSFVRAMLGRPGPNRPGRFDRWLGRVRDEVDRRHLRHPERRPWYLTVRPLPFTRADLVLSWSAKSGSMAVLWWYLAVENRLRAARAVAAGPHAYVSSHLYWSWRIARRLPVGEELSSWTLMRVMRNPLRRLVSGFRHAVRTGYADRDLTRLRGREIRAAEGLSIVEYLELLAAVDVSDCNAHHRLQRNPVDDLDFGRVVTIDIDSEDLDAALRRVSAEFGLPSIPLDSLPMMEHLAWHHHAPPDDASRIGDRSDEELLHHRFTVHDTRHHWPGRRLAALPEVQEAARRLYAPDWAWLEQHRSPSP